MSARTPALVLITALASSASAGDHAPDDAPAGTDDHHEHHGHHGHHGHEAHDPAPDRPPTVARAGAPSGDADDAHHGHARHAGHAEHAEHADAGVLGGGHHHGHGQGASWAASLGLIAATYDARLFSGDYQGAVAGARFARGRFALGASLPAYRLQKNGKVVGGIGDLMLHGHATLLGHGAVTAGVMGMASAPTGDGDQGLGMGHVMLMGDAWAAWTSARFAATGSLGYARALGGSLAHAEHGSATWPLVEPMNASEVTCGATGMVALARALATGLSVRGAVPIGDGATRLVGGVRVMWREGRVDTSVEIQGGLVGDPFGVRGVVETTLRFE